MKRVGKLAAIVLVVLVGGFLLIQLVPYGRAHTNPPVLNEAPWDSPQTRTLAERACFDCHSNETEWPWYTNVAPASWLIQRDVDEGREDLNFSEWGSRGEGEEIEELVEVILEGEMPPVQYLPLHPDARLTAAEKQQLADGLEAMTGDLRTEREDEEAYWDDD